MSMEKSTLGFVFQLFRFILNTLIIFSWNFEISFLKDKQEQFVILKVSIGFHLLCKQEDPFDI